MDQEQTRALLRQIEAFELSDPQAAVEFETQLADANGWTRGYAAAVTREYRRFLYLTQVAGHMVCPSDEVDQAWHLHLTQTVSYQRLAQLLPAGFLHHHPSQGGPQELAKHQAMYQRTLDAYEAHFGAKPPPEFWPSVAQRFALRRPSVPVSPGVAKVLGRRADTAAPLLLAGMVFGGLLLNLLPMQDLWRHIGGMAYVGFFVVMLVASAGVASDDDPEPAAKRQGLWADPYEVAYLEGGSTACSEPPWPVWWIWVGSNCWRSATTTRSRVSAAARSITRRAPCAHNCTRSSATPSTGCPWATSNPKPWKPWQDPMPTPSARAWPPAITDCP